jgi:glycosyltransferase involved in cell wall biosynthesis
MNISVVIPLLDEEESLPELSEWIVRVMKQSQFTYEIVFVDDGSKDKSWSVIEKLSAENSCIRGIKFRRNYGKSAGLQVGFEAAQGDVIITMDADLQDSPDEIPELYRMITQEGWDLVSGWKQNRKDPLSKTIPTKIFNWATRKMTGISLHDFNCGLKAYKKDVIKSIEVYGEMHRYIPVIAKWAGFPKIGEKGVVHNERKYGVGKFFGMERFVYGFLDLLTITFVSKFGKRPMHFFGTLGTLMFGVGFLTAVYLGALKLIHVYHHVPARQLADRPSFFIALTTMVIGTMLFLAGFLGELISRNSPVRNNYLIEKKTV